MWTEIGYAPWTLAVSSDFWSRSIDNEQPCGPAVCVSLVGRRRTAVVSANGALTPEAGFLHPFDVRPAETFRSWLQIPGKLPNHPQTLVPGQLFHV
jgi:hypothetical protein